MTTPLDTFQNFQKKIFLLFLCIDSLWRSTTTATSTTATTGTTGTNDIWIRFCGFLALEILFSLFCELRDSKQKWHVWGCAHCSVQFCIYLTLWVVWQDIFICIYFGWGGAFCIYLPFSMLFFLSSLAWYCIYFVCLWN